MSINKKNLGQYFTKKNVWYRPQITKFIKDNLPLVIVDPFAGNGDLFFVANELGVATKGFDIDSVLGWELNDSLSGVPKIDNGLVLTNPPYLAKNSAKRQGLDNYKYFKDDIFQDLYQIAIQKVLESYDVSVFIIPETFFTTTFFKEHLYSITILEDNPFDDTDFPVCVCCFKKSYGFPQRVDYKIYKGDKFLFTSEDLVLLLGNFTSKVRTTIEFNTKQGNLGLRGVDGVGIKDRMKFCFPEDLNYDLDSIKVSSRAITVIDVDYKIDKKFIDTLNNYLEGYRTHTDDVFLSPFKGNNKVGNRRRRIDFKLARQLINKTIEKLNN